ncbi:MAG: antibiotic biosynthesis monooxygenase [Acidobacteria bacterium]|nr:antibiotic biosynthesis monooxygenase [Acidobacteriota bacterium]
MDEPAGLVTIVAKEGKVDQLIELLGRMAAIAAKDDGSELYSVHRSRRDPNTVFVYELYRDKEALKLHQANEELRGLGAGLRDLTESIDVVLGNLVTGDRPTRG